MSLRTGAPRLGLGLAALGRPGYINLGRGEDLGAARAVEQMEARTFAVLDRAWAAGVRYVDAARSYGRAEAFLSRWLSARGRRPSDLTIGSKWGYTYVAEWRVDAETHEVKDHRRAVLDRQWVESWGLLGRHLDLYQVHSATLDSGVLSDGAVHAGLAELRAAHGIRIGLSLSGPGQADTLRRALDVTVDGAPLFDAVQATWNLLEPSVGGALEAAHDRGLAVIVKEGVANGRLTARGLGTLPEAAQRRLEARAAAHAVGVDAVALAGVLARPFVDVVLSGAVTEAQLEANLAAAKVAWGAEDEALLEVCRAPADAYWARRKALAWS